MKDWEWITEKIESLHIAGADIGTKLPTEEELCKEFNVSRTMLRKALKRLSNSGRLASRRGSGYYVDYFKKSICMKFNESFFELGLNYSGFDVNNVVGPLEIEDPSIASALRIHRAYSFEIVRSFFDRPVALSINYLPAVSQISSAQDLENTLKNLRSVSKTLEYFKFEGFRRVYTEVSARPATLHEQKQLHLSADDIILHTGGVNEDFHSKRIEYTSSSFPAKFWKLQSGD